MLPALLPIALQIAGAAAPRLARWIAGDKAGKIAEQVVDVAEKIAGVDEPEDALAKIKADPALMAELQMRLADIEIAQFEAETAQLRERERTNRAALASNDQFVRRARPTGLYVAALLFFLIGLTGVIAIIGATLAAVNGNAAEATALLTGVASLIASIMPVAVAAAGMGGLYVNARSNDKAVAAGQAPAPTVLGDLGRAVASRIAGSSTRPTGAPPAADPL